MITLDRLREALSYNPMTGVFTWNSRRTGGRIPPNNQAGSPVQGYICIMVDQKRCYAHRLAWFYTYGTWPAELDHINGDKADNRISNLRECSRSQNLGNRAKMPFNRSGFKGVFWNQSGWGARIQKDRRRIALGTYKTKEEAYDAYCRAAREQYGEFARV